jgi:hypothetical protein
VVAYLAQYSTLSDTAITLRFAPHASHGLKLSQAEILPAQSRPSHWAAVAYQSRCEP